MSLNDLVRTYWERQPCGTGAEIVGDEPSFTLEWAEKIERHRYKAEPDIHAVAQFTRWHGRQVLEIGVGAGTDHLQFARAGADLSGVDLTDAAIETTRRRLALYGFTSRLQRVDAEQLPFEDASFDLVYSWGVVHHAEHPNLIVDEVHRVLRPGGQFRGMLYNRHSALVGRMWLRHGLRNGRPLRPLAELIAENMESDGTKAYLPAEVRRLFGDYSSCEVTPLLTPYDTAGIPARLLSLLPPKFGWFLAVVATR